MGWYHDLSAWGWVSMTIGMLLCWGLVIAGVLVRAVGRNDEPPVAPPTPDAEEPLAVRFARRKIDEVGYQGRLATLCGQTPPAVRS